MLNRLFLFEKKILHTKTTAFRLLWDRILQEKCFSCRFWASHLSMNVNKNALLVEFEIYTWSKTFLLIFLHLKRNISNFQSIFQHHYFSTHTKLYIEEQRHNFSFIATIQFSLLQPLNHSVRPVILHLQKSKLNSKNLFFYNLFKIYFDLL